MNHQGPPVQGFFCLPRGRKQRDEEAIRFPKEQFVEANLLPRGQVIRQRNVVPGGRKGRTAEEKEFQPHVQEGSVFLLVDRPAGLAVLAQVGSPVGDVALGR